MVIAQDSDAEAVILNEFVTRKISKDEKRPLQRGFPLRRKVRDTMRRRSGGRGNHRRLHADLL